MVPSVLETSCFDEASIAERTSTSRIEESCARRQVSMTNVEMKQVGDSAASFRINLRKRTVNDDERQGVVMSSYNSAFLSGLFADIAKATESSPEEGPLEPQDPRLDHSVSFKKSRLSLTHSISRCSKSFANLAATESLDAPPSPSVVSAGSDESDVQTSRSRDNSLSYQLNFACGVGSREAEKLAFPHLPATISDSSCGSSSLTRINNGRQTPEPEILSTKDGYGWFVEMEDEEDDVNDVSVDTHKSNARGLAFQAPTAPKAVNHDAEVEWAKAADTVDDVLGAFF